MHGDETFDHVPLALADFGHVDRDGLRQCAEPRTMAHQIRDLRAPDLILAGQAIDIGARVRRTAASNTSTERKAEDRTCLRMVRRRHADVIAAVRIISIALDFLRRNDHPCPVFAPPSEQTRPNIFDFGRVAVLLVAATLARVIRHVPGAVELFVKLHVLRGMVMLLSLGREREAKKHQAKTRKEAHGTKEGHDEPPSGTGFRHSPTSARCRPCR